MSLTEMEALLDSLHRRMCVAYDKGDMIEWGRLKEVRERIGRQYRAACAVAGFDD